MRVLGHDRLDPFVCSALTGLASPDSESLPASAAEGGRPAAAAADERPDLLPLDTAEIVRLIETNMLTRLAPLPAMGNGHDSLGQSGRDGLGARHALYEAIQKGAVLLNKDQSESLFDQWGFWLRDEGRVLLREEQQRLDSLAETLGLEIESMSDRLLQKRAYFWGAAAQAIVLRTVVEHRFVALPAETELVDIYIDAVVDLVPVRSAKEDAAAYPLGHFVERYAWWTKHRAEANPQNPTGNRFLELVASKSEPPRPTEAECAEYLRRRLEM